jgi:hypothetical protein
MWNIRVSKVVKVVSLTALVLVISYGTSPPTPNRGCSTRPIPADHARPPRAAIAAAKYPMSGVIDIATGGEWPYGEEPKGQSSPGL